MDGFFGEFGLLGTLGFAGAILTWDRRSRLWLLYALIATYAVSVATFYVFARYRFPLVPFLALFAAAAVVEFRPYFRAAGPARIASLLLALAAAMVVFHWPMVDRSRMGALTHYNLGQALALDGQVEASVAEYRLALEVDATFAEARNKLGIALARKGARSPRPFTSSPAALQADPSFEEVHNNLGSLRLQRGEIEAATRHFESSIALNPDNLQGYLNLGAALLRAEDLAGARRAYLRAIRLDPGNPQVHNNLGIIAAIRGDLEIAARRFEDALRIDPDYDEARENLGRALGRPP